MKNILGAFGVDFSQYREAGRRDQGLILMFLPAIVYSAIIAALSIAFSIYFFIGSKPISFAIGTVFLFGIFQHHKSLLHNINRTAICVVIVISLGISLVISLPLKFYADQETYTRYYIEENERKQREAKSLVQKQIDVERKKYTDNIQKGADVYQENRQSLADARRNLKKFEANVYNQHKVMLESALTDIGYSENLDMSEMAIFKFFLLRNFGGGDISDKLMYWMFVLTIFLLEGSPGIIALALQGGQYMESVGHRKRIFRKVIKKREVAEHDIVDDVVDDYGIRNEENLTKRKLIHATMEMFENNFDETSTGKVHDFTERLRKSANVNSRFSSNGHDPDFENKFPNDDFPVFDYNENSES